MDTTEKKVTFVMPRELHVRLKVIAARDGKSVQEILNGLSSAYVAKKEAETSG